MQERLEVKVERRADRKSKTMNITALRTLRPFSSFSFDCVCDEVCV